MNLDKPPKIYSDPPEMFSDPRSWSEELALTSLQEVLRAQPGRKFIPVTEVRPLITFELDGVSRIGRQALTREVETPDYIIH